jgi:hypothetical protein
MTEKMQFYAKKEKIKQDILRSLEDSGINISEELDDMDLETLLQALAMMDVSLEAMPEEDRIGYLRQIALNAIAVNLVLFKKVDLEELDLLS